MSVFVFPVRPQTVHCPECDRDVAVAVNLNKPGIESECKNQACPIAADQDFQPTGNDGTLICFADPDRAKPREKQAEMLTLKPGLWGVSLDLKELWRRLCRSIKK